MLFPLLFLWLILTHSLGTSLNAPSSRKLSLIFLSLPRLAYLSGCVLPLPLSYHFLPFCFSFNRLSSVFDWKLGEGRDPFTCITLAPVPNS